MKVRAMSLSELKSEIAALRAKAVTESLEDKNVPGVPKLGVKNRRVLKASRPLLHQPQPWPHQLRGQQMEPGPRTRSRRATSPRSMRCTGARPMVMRVSSL